MVHAVTDVDYNMGSEVEVILCRKYKGKSCFRWSALMKDYISAYKSEMAFVGLNFKEDQPSLNAKLRAIMAEL